VINIIKFVLVARGIHLRGLYRYWECESKEQKTMSEDNKKQNEAKEVTSADVTGGAQELSANELEKVAGGAGHKSMADKSVNLPPPPPPPPPGSFPD
jgi:hypothetical protein